MTIRKRLTFKNIYTITCFIILLSNDQRIHEIEYGCFCPLIFSTSGGLGPVSTLVYKRIALLQSEKFRIPYYSLIILICCKLSFSILRSTIPCLRGTQSTFFHVLHLNTLLTLIWPSLMMIQQFHLLVEQ